MGHPANLTTGSYQFRDITNPLVGMLFEGKVIYDLTNGHVSYGCAACCATSSVYLTYNPFSLGLGTSFQNGVWTKDNCGDPPEDDSEAFYDWTTANSAIAKTTSAGMHTGMSVGSTTSSTYGEVVVTNGRNGCYLLPRTPSGPTNVAKPSGMLFFSDLTTKSNVCATPSKEATERLIQYQIVSASQAPVGIVPMQETFLMQSNDTCTTAGLSSPTPCNSQGVAATGIFTDYLSTNACSPPDAGSCGFSITPDAWQWCPSGQPVVTIGKPTYNIYWQAIYVDGSTSSIAPLTPVPNN